MNHTHPSAAEFIAMGEEKFVSLTTFRRTGAAVSTPVCVARDGDTLVVTTPAGSGKVKRIRRDARVELRPCGRTGKVEPGAAVVGGRAVVMDDAAAHDRVADAVRRKYGLEYLLVMGVERIARREGRRVAVHITAV